MTSTTKHFLTRAVAIFLPRKKATYVASVCGHPTKLTALLRAFDDEAVVDVPQNERQLPIYCSDCVAKRTIRCAWCLRAIFVGDPVTLHRTRAEFLVPANAHVYCRSPLRLVGCMHPDCVDKSDPMSGFWRMGTDGAGYVAEVEETKEKFRLRFSNRKRHHYVGPHNK